MPTVALGNISLTLPPETLRKAAPQNPVTKRKVRKTTANAKCLVKSSVQPKKKKKEKSRVARTNSVSKSDRDAEDEEQRE